MDIAVPEILNFVCHLLHMAHMQGRTQGGGGIWVETLPLELDILQNFITLARRLIVFAYFLLANLSTNANTTE